MFAQQFPPDLNGIIFSRQRMRRVEGRVSIPAAITANDQNNWIVIAKMTIPSTDVGFITSYSNAVIDPSWDYNNAILFRLRINGQPVDDCTSFQEQRGTIPSPADALAYVRSNDLVVLEARRAILGTGPRDVVMSAVLVTWNQQMASSRPKAN